MRREGLIVGALACACAIAAMLALPSMTWTPVTLVCVALLGVALLASWRARPIWIYIPCSIVIALAAIVVLAYLYGTGTVDDVGPIAPMPLPMAVAFLLAAITILAVVPHGFVNWALFGTDAGAILLRRILPVALIVLPSLGFLRVLLEKTGRANDHFAIAANITVASSVLIAFIIRAAWGLRRLDADRTAAHAALKALNRDLSDRVRQRSEELERERTRVALLQDRDRIARDLHDRVIQRLFASGLNLAGMQAGVEPKIAKRLDEVVGELDSVIRELRETIFQLESGGGLDPRFALTGTMHRAERLLGFAPQLTIIGDIGLLEADVAAHLLAVTHETLTNTIRHAGATRVTVELTIDEVFATLRVADNGRGMPEALSHRSGLANIQSRAAEVGGSVSWERAVPRGTVVTFRTPVTRSSGQLTTTLAT